jgi:hypothetical protein
VSAKRAKYEVLTWDTEVQKFTPQLGVRRGPYTLFGLRKAVRKLRDLGDPAATGDPMVLVQRLDDESVGRDRRHLKPGTAKGGAA